MFAPNRHYKSIERKNTVYTKIPFQEFKIRQVHHIVLHFPSFIERIRKCLCFVHDLASYQNISRMIFHILRRSFVGFRLHSKVLQSPSQDSIHVLSYFAVWCLCSCVQFRHTWVSCKIFFILSGYKMHHNNLNTGKLLMISVTYQSHFVLWWRIGGGANFGSLDQNFRYGPWWNQMDIISLEMDYMTPKTPDNILSHLMFYEKHKNIQNVYKTSFSGHFGILPIKR